MNVGKDDCEGFAISISKKSITSVTSLKWEINARGKLSTISNLVGLYINGVSYSEM